MWVSTSAHPALQNSDEQVLELMVFSLRWLVREFGCEQGRTGQCPRRSPPTNTFWLAKVNIFIEATNLAKWVRRMHDVAVLVLYSLVVHIPFSPFRV